MLFTIKGWSEKFDYPTQSGLRYLIFNSHKNGFDSVIRRVGRRVLIDEKAFFDWVDENSQGKKVAS